ncbi:MAG: YdcF family protein [Desulfuromonadaceae bacterium]
MTACCLISSFLLLVVFAIFAPGFLFTEDATRKADAVVLFVGPGNEARVDEARYLIKEGYAHYLLIPSSGEIFTADSAGVLVHKVADQSHGNLNHRIMMAANYKKYLENTHIETLEAKRMLDDLDLRSAMLVSSAFHMRRIRMIAGRVFDERKYSISCNPARWQQEFTVADWLNAERRKIIVSEYVKIGWFLVYGVF